MIAVRVHGVALLPPDETPVMLLREIAGDRRWLPISIGAPEAGALIEACQRVEHARPDTIELIGQVIEAFGRRVQRVEVTALDEGVFFADLVLADGTRISARPSDAVALGVRAGVPLEVAENVLAVAAADLELADGTDGTDSAEGAVDPESAGGAGGIEAMRDVEREIADFRDQLAEASPDDFTDTPPDQR